MRGSGDMLPGKTFRILGKSFLVLCTVFSFWFEIIDSSIDSHSSGMQW